MIIEKKRENGTLCVSTQNDEPSMTDQSAKESCDINSIMRQYHQTGMITHLNRKQGVYGDFTEVKDYQASLDTVIAANAAFLELPSAVRARFSNNPQELINFVSDVKNRDEAISLGLINKPEPQKQNDTNLKQNEINSAQSK